MEASRECNGALNEVAELFGPAAALLLIVNQVRVGGASRQEGAVSAKLLGISIWRNFRNRVADGVVDIRDSANSQRGRGCLKKGVAAPMPPDSRKRRSSLPASRRFQSKRRHACAECGYSAGRKERAAAHFVFSVLSFSFSFFFFFFSFLFFSWSFLFFLGLS